MPLQNVCLTNFRFQKYTAILKPNNIPNPNHSSSIEFTIKIKMRCISIFTYALGVKLFINYMGKPTVFIFRFNYVKLCQLQQSARQPAVRHQQQPTSTQGGPATINHHGWANVK